MGAEQGRGRVVTRNRVSVGWQIRTGGIVERGAGEGRERVETGIQHRCGEGTGLWGGDGQGANQVKGG